MEENKFYKTCTKIALFLIVFLIMFIFCIFVKHKNNATIKSNPIVYDTVYFMPTKSDTILAMADAFSYVESRHTDNAISPCGKYIGCLQISEICVREANRILKDTAFTYDDRYDKIMSYAIFEVLQLHHNPSLDIDRAIDIWNKNCPNRYRNNVKEQYFINLNNI